MKTISNPQPIRVLNDQMRKTLCEGRIVVTAGIRSLGPVAMAEILKAVAAFEEFTPDNDPHGEHDFGSLTYKGQLVLWKIDYYDLDLTMHSPDPADPNVTTRVLTIMLADEY